MLWDMLLVEADLPHGWCVRNVITGEYRARRLTREAADSMVDAWVRQTAEQLVPRHGVQVETPPLTESWHVTVLEGWALVGGRWWAYADNPRRWVPLELIRRHWPRERNKR